MRRWLLRAGAHREAVPIHLLAQQPIELGIVQADELWVKVVGRRLWVALALAVPSRFWLGGCLSPHRADALIRQLVSRVRAAARSLAVVVCVDGFASYVRAFTRAFRVAERTGRLGRPRLRPAPGFGLGQVLKQRLSQRVVAVTRRAVVGALPALVARLVALGGGTDLNTASIERLNATFRARLAPLGRRTRRLVRTDATLHAWLWLVGVVYTCCQPHRSLRARLIEAGTTRWRLRTSALAAGLADHVWSLDEARRCPVPRPRLVTWDRRTGRITASLAPPELLGSAA